MDLLFMHVDLCRSIKSILSQKVSLAEKNIFHLPQGYMAEAVKTCSERILDSY